MERRIIAYKSVFDSDTMKEFNFEDLIKNQSSIFEGFGIEDFETELERIKNIKSKEDRNIAKRNFIPAVDLSMSGVLSIDIDGISDKPDVKDRIIRRLSALTTCLAAMESVSGNIVVFFKYDCLASEFKFLYYKIYLEMTLLLGVNIDFLPEIGRLRYVSLGEVFIYNEDSEELTEIIECETLPYINTQVGNKKARGVIYGSN